MKSPKPRTMSSSENDALHPARNVTADLQQLTDQFQLGLLTEYGFQVRKARLLGIPLDAAFTKSSTERLSSPSHPTSASRYKILNPDIAEQEDDQKESEKGTTKRKRTSPANWQSDTDSLRKSGSGRTTAAYSKSSLKNLDAFADSLRYVNRLFNDAFGIEARKVPAHIPHFIDKNVMQELQRKFPKQFANTSATRVRSSHDMQFAFSYFYFIMDSEAHLEISEIFTEMDIDHSGSWNEREVFVAALRVADGPTDSVAIQRFYTLLTNCTRLHLLHGKLVSSEGISSSLNRSDILNCQPLVQLILKANQKRKRFKFRLGDAESFTFIRVGNNETSVSRELDSILRQPRKFICINDEVDYTREDSWAVQVAIRDFFQTLYPLASPFELPPDTRNSIGHIEELDSWERRRYWIFGGLCSLTFLLFASLICFCFPRLRWRLRRLFHLRGVPRNRRIIRVTKSNV